MEGQEIGLVHVVCVPTRRVLLVSWLHSLNTVAWDSLLEAVE